jgi:hypothetical protein
LFKEFIPVFLNSIQKRERTAMAVKDVAARTVAPP